MSIDAIRSLITGENRHIRRKTLGILVEGERARLAKDGEEPTYKLDVRQPTIAERNAILRAGKVAGTGAVENPGALAVEAAILCAVEHDGSGGLGKPIFSAAHREALQNQPAGGIVEVIGNEALSLMRADEAEAGKGSTETETSTSASVSPAA